MTQVITRFAILFSVVFASTGLTGCDDSKKSEAPKQVIAPPGPDHKPQAGGAGGAAPPAPPAPPKK